MTPQLRNCAFWTRMRTVSICLCGLIFKENLKYGTSQNNILDSLKDFDEMKYEFAVRIHYDQPC